MSETPAQMAARFCQEAKVGWWQNGQNAPDITGIKKAEKVADEIIITGQVPKLTAQEAAQVLSILNP